MHIKAGLEPDPEPLVDINTTPLVDVLLVLLVMLIITIPVQLHTADIEMPGATAPPATPPVVVRIDVTPAGRYLWNGEPVLDRPSLEQRLAEAAAQENQPEIHLRPNRAAKYEQVAAVLSTAQRLGLVKVGLIGNEQFAN